MSSWRTTLLGVLSILAAVTGAGMSMLNGHPVDFPTVIAAIMAGVGLIKAKDHAV